jgi:hypothetical protein
MTVSRRNGDLMKRYSVKRALSPMHHDTKNHGNFAMAALEPRQGDSIPDFRVERAVSCCPVQEQAQELNYLGQGIHPNAT